MLDDQDLPDYARMFSAYHRAYAAELRDGGGIADPGRYRVLDVACGDGAYAGWLAERVGPDGRVVALDLLPAFLDQARSWVDPDRVRLVAADLGRLPFANGSFDLVWCAQSLYSLPRPVESVRLMALAVRPGGVLAVLENDTLHHVLLPWPIEVELAVRGVELAKQVERPRKFYVGRRRVDVFRDAGLSAIVHRSHATDRQAPLDFDARSFLVAYLDDLRGRVLDHLDPSIRHDFDRLTDPDSPAFLLDRPGFVATTIDHVVTARRL